MTSHRKLTALAAIVFVVLAGTSCERTTAPCANGTAVYVAGPLISADGTGWSRIDGEDNGAAAIAAACGTSGDGQGWPTADDVTTTTEDLGVERIDGVRPF